MLFFSTLSVFSQIVINEFSASNLSTTTDNYNKNEDWIEVFNQGATPFDLSGYYLSDDINNPTKWQIPSGVSVPANGVRIIWASGRDEFIGNNVHANFKISQSKPNPEYIVFSDAGGNILESYNLHVYKTQMNHSYGRISNGSATWGVFTTPTPNASNTTNSYQKYAEMPVFSVSGGFYPSAVNVSITTPEPNSVIRYTIDGNTPTATSATYSSSLNITNTTIVQARVYSNNPQILPSIYEFHTYFINVSHTIPVVSIAGTNVSNLLGGNSSSPLGCVEYYENGLLEAKVTGEFNKHGNDSWAYDQRGIDFVSRDEHGYADALRHKIFALKNRNAFQRVIFKAAANDNYPFSNGGAHIRDSYIHELSERANLELDERTYEPCVLYLNGQYWGVYDTREKVDDSDFTEYYYGQDKTEIYYLKTWGGTWSEYGGNAAQNDWDNLRNYIQNNNMGNPSNYAYVNDRLNLLSLIDYFIINTHTVCSDWLNWNTAWWKGTNPAGQSLKWRYTLWDMDATFGHYINYTGIPNSTPNADPCFGENLPNPGGQGHTTIMQKLIDESPEFKQLYVTRYADLMNSGLSCDAMIQLLDELVNRIAPEMPAQITRWGGNLTTWQNNVQAIRDFINQRCLVYEQAFVDCYNLAGPYNVVLNVNPPGSGSIDLNLINITNFAFTGTFYGNVSNNLIANANPGYTFSHWELLHHTPSPNATSANINLTFSSSDTIIAHFTQVSSPKKITLLVQPPGSGEININAFTPTFYPWSGTFPDSTFINLQASALSGYTFSNWSSQSHTLLPNPNAQQVNFMLLNIDTITAFFIENIVPQTFTLSVNVFPINSGEVLLNNSTTIELAQSETYNAPQLITLNAIEKNNYIFSHWSINNHVLSPDNFDKDVSFVINQNENVTAHFNLEETGIYFPQTFSPDGDGLNEVFAVQTTYEIETCEIFIYSRWGDLIFSSNKADFSWDGTFKGKECPTDSYAYIFNYRLAGSESMKTIMGGIIIYR